MSQPNQAEEVNNPTVVPVEGEHIDPTAANRTYIESGSLDSVDPLNLYSPFNETYEAWERTLRNLGKMIPFSWAECDDRELAKRHSLVPEMVRATLEMLAYTTGCEIYATGLYIENKQGWKFQTSTPRTQHFGRTKQGKEAHTNFTNYCTEFIGPALCTNYRCPAPVIYPHPDKDARPIFPLCPSTTYPQNQRLLHDFFSYQIRMSFTFIYAEAYPAYAEWQGGAPPVPYDLIKAQFLAGEGKIVSRTHLPPQLSYLKDPMLMTKSEISIMVEHIIAGQEARLPAANTFRFEEYCPGAYAHESLTGRDGDVSIFYWPDTRSFASAVEALRRSTPPPPIDGMPMISTETPYVSLPAEAIAAYSKILPATDPWWKLPVALNEHNTCHPVHASRELWYSRTQEFPHLRKDEPFPGSAGDHLVSEQGWLPIIFFNWRDLNHSAWCLATIIQWCQPRYWLHTESQTVFGGPLGIEWPIVVMGHLRHQVNRFKNPNNCWRSHYEPYSEGLSADVKLAFEDTAIEQIDATIDDLLAALLDSTTRLKNSLEARKSINPERSVIRTCMDAHTDLPSSSTDFHTITPLPPDDPWDEPWEDKLIGSGSASKKSNESLTGNLPIDDLEASDRAPSAPRTSPSRLRPIKRVTIGGNAGEAEEPGNRTSTEDRG